MVLDETYTVDYQLHTALEPHGAVARWDDQQLRCLRACVMKPDHLEWLPQILERLDRAAADVLAGPG